MEQYVIPAGVLAVVGALLPSLINIVVKGVKESWLRFVIAGLCACATGLAGIFIFKPFTTDRDAVIKFHMIEVEHESHNIIRVPVQADGKAGCLIRVSA